MDKLAHLSVGMIINLMIADLLGLVDLFMYKAFSLLSFSYSASFMGLDNRVLTASEGELTRKLLDLLHCCESFLQDLLLPHFHWLMLNTIIWCLLFAFVSLLA